MDDDAPNAVLTVKPTETPASPATGQSEALARPTATTAQVKDERGRVLTIRKLSAVLKLDLSMVVGAEGVQNEGVIGPCSMAWSVTQIDGEDIYQPRTYEELRALVARLDDEGLMAVQDCVMANWPPRPVSADTVKNS